MAGRTQTPYDLKTLFVACPNKNITTRGSESFIIQSSMTWNNTGKTISQIQIDFANGQGFQTVTVGTPISVTYADTGFKKWTVKVTLNDNSILQCYNEYNVLKTPNSASRFNSLQSEVPIWGNIASVNGTRSAATVWVNYSRNNFTGTLRKPLIIVEGYDVSFISPSLQDDYTAQFFIDRQLEEAKTVSWDFNGQLDDAGYDLVFINFANGAADIVLNGGAVQEVISRVNANKVIDTRPATPIRQQNVVMGLSMGGLCARYALANMTKNISPASTETRLLITHDSPHKGANVPLGLQYMIRMLGGVQLFGYNVYDIYPDYNDAIGLLNAPATQQLLLYRATTTNAFANNTFLDATYRPMITFGTTGPQPTYRFIATANGNECANPLFAPGKTFINLGAGVSAGIYARFLFFKVPILSYKLGVAVEAYALPVAGSTNKIARVYSENSLKLFGFINIFKQLYNNTAYAPGTHLAVDGVPGSNYPLLDVDALNQLTTAPIFKVNLYVSFPLGPFLGGYFGVYAYNAGVSYNFTFVSVGSALDVSPYNTNTFSQKYVNGVNQSYPSTSETFIAQETVQNSPSVSNNVHIRFTARNSRWLFKEMELQPNLENCSAECSNPYYMTGSDLICTNGIYTVPYLPRGATVVWSASPLNIVSIAPNANGSQATITKAGAGNVTISAAINACTQTTVTKAIHVGGYSSGDYPVSGSSSSCKSTTVYFSTVTLPGAISYTWFWPGDWTNASGQGTPNLSVRTSTTSGQVGVRVANACDAGGSPGIIFVNVNTFCGSNFIVSPNPAADNVTITVKQTESTTAAGSSSVSAGSNRTTGFVKVQLFDKLGSIKKTYNYAKGTTLAKLDVSALIPDVYVLKIFDGTDWEEHKIIVSH